MHGLFGAMGSVGPELGRLRRDFEEVWGASAIQWVAKAGMASMGVVASEGSALATTGERWLAWSGESCGQPVRNPFSQQEWAAGVGVEILPGPRGVIRGDPSGAFPLYFAERPAGLMFSTHARPLGRAIGAPPDPVGVGQFIREAFMFGQRTAFQGVRRVGPGQAVRWDPSGGLSIEEGSRAWVGLVACEGPEEAAEEIEPLLRRAVRRRLQGSGHVLMMSAGWDSRTLLASAAAEGLASRVSAYSHGDTKSRELAIAEKLCRSAGVAWSAKDIDASVWDVETLNSVFARTESLLFPHWAMASTRHRDAGSVFSGVLGEVIGGHYGATQVNTGWKKAVALMRSVADSRSDEVPASEVVPQLRKGWIGPSVSLLEAGMDRGDLLDAFNEDIDAEATRLCSRGVATGAQLLEAFVTEHRGSQYISAQTMSSGLETEVAIPFADRELFRFASCVPSTAKVHNRVNIALVRRLYPELARLPLAATLVPASMPLLVQEGSRLVRKSYQQSRWWASWRSGGLIPRPRLSWVDFDFVVGSAMDAVVDSLSPDLWNVDLIRTSVDAVRRKADPRTYHPMFDQLGKTLTMDRMLS